jgi:hypothetical protein
MNFSFDSFYNLHRCFHDIATIGFVLFIRYPGNQLHIIVIRYIIMLNITLHYPTVFCSIH